jgi:hypothetical protein
VISQAFRVLVALLVAVPLGAGGLCCCLLGSPAAAHDAAVPSTPSCCAGESTPIATPASAEHEDDCSCPARDAGVLAKSAPVESAAPVAPAAVVPAAAPSVAVVIAFAGLAVHATPYPPPKVPLFRTLCTILC